MPTRQPYPFQEEGIAHLVVRGGGFLWDQPGLGKTTQAIFAAKELASGDGGPILVVCPNSLKQMWRDEIKEIFPDDTVIVAEQAGRLNGRGSVTELYFKDELPNWLIVHYAGVRISKDDYVGVPWSVVVVDECHNIKNRKAERTKAIIAITPKHAYRIGLTATPYSQEPSGLWSQLRWMCPDDDNMRSFWKFYKKFVNFQPVQTYRNGKQITYRKIVGGKNLELLAEIMSGYGLRRTKGDVAPQLPPLTRTSMPLEMTDKQKDVYDKLKNQNAVEFQYVNQDGELQHMTITNALARITRLEQWLSHPWTFIPGEEGSKIAWLREHLASHDEPVVIATRFKESARYIAEIFDDECAGAITGDLSNEERDRIAKSWKEGSERILVGTAATIGTGHSFERASILIAYDQVYSTIQMEQMDHRIHRITSKGDKIQVIYLYNKGTTNEVVLKSFTKKWNQIELVREFLKHIQEDKDGHNGS